VTSPLLGHAIRRAWRARKVVLLVWGLGLLVALPVGLMTAQIVGGFISKSGVAEQFATRLQPLYAVDLFMHKQDALRGYLPVAIGVIVLWGLLAPWLHGTIFFAVHRGPAGAASRALANYGRLLRLGPLTWLLGVLLAAPLGFGALTLGTDGLESWTSEKQVFLVRAAILLVLGLVVGWWRATSEMMRAELLMHADRGVFRAFLRGLRAGLRRPWAPVLIGVLWLAGILVLSLAVSLLDTRLPRAGWGAIVMGVALQQGTALLRAGLRVVFVAAVVTREELRLGLTPGAD
jgi:hypothetical protein